MKGKDKEYQPQSIGRVGVIYYDKGNIPVSVKILDEWRQFGKVYFSIKSKGGTPVTILADRVELQ